MVFIYIIDSRDICDSHPTPGVICMLLCSINISHFDISTLYFPFKSSTF